MKHSVKHDLSSFFDTIDVQATTMFKGQVRQTRKFPRKDPTGDLGVTYVVLKTSTDKKSRDPYVGVEYAMFYSRSTVPRKDLTGKRHVTKSELTEP